MPEITLVAEPGRTTGSAESRRLRAAGRIPAVLYGHGMEAVSVSVDGRDLRHALSGGAGLNQLLNLKIEGDEHLALARSLQRHPVRHTVLHVDFLVVRRDEVISAEVPVILTGAAVEVEREKGIIEHQLTSLTVRATPAQIPPHLEVDISNLTIGEGIRVGDLRLPSGVTTDASTEEVIVLATIPRAAIELELVELAEAAEAAEAEAGPEGQAPAAGEGGAPAEASAEQPTQEG
jgi:large subunit ribosomal protein L25